jgi:PIN domain nuclease of toxin-antitoxin system
MNRVVHLDTHVVLWLYERSVQRLKPALAHLEGRKVALSPMAMLELEYLREIGRSRVGAAIILAELSVSVGLELARTPWEQVVSVALSLGWARDPFDRLIAAHALTDRVPLVTADKRLRASCPNAIWG